MYLMNENGFEYFEKLINQKEGFYMSNLIIAFMLICVLCNPGELCPTCQTEITSSRDFTTEADFEVVRTSREEYDDDVGSTSEEEIDANESFELDDPEPWRVHSNEYLRPGYSPSILEECEMEDGYFHSIVIRGGEVVSDRIIGVARQPEFDPSEVEQDDTADDEQNREHVEIKDEKTEEVK